MGGSRRDQRKRQGGSRTAGAKRAARRPAAASRRTADPLDPSARLRRSWGALVREARGIAEQPDPLEAEVFASGIISVFGAAEDPGSGQTLLAAFVRHVERDMSPDAMALVTAIAALGPPAIRPEAEESEARLRAAGVPVPIWAGRIGRAAFRTAWRSTDEYGDQDLIAAVFDHAGTGSHVVMTLVDHNIGHLLKDAWVGRDPERTGAIWEEHSEMARVPISAEDVALAWTRGLDAFDSYLDPPVAEGLVRTRALLEARLVGLPKVSIPEERELRPTKRRSIRRAFLKSPEGRDHGDDAGIVDQLIDFKADYLDGDPLRWSPVVVEICLLDWFPRKVILEAAGISRLPAVVRSFVRYAGREKGLSERSLGVTLAAIDAFEPEFADAMRDPARAGPAKEVFAAMLADGLDVTDPAALQDWLDGWNEARAGGTSNG